MRIVREGPEVLWLGASAGRHGRFECSGLEPGTYTIHARKEGFGQAIVRGVRVDRGGAPSEHRVVIVEGAPLRVDLQSPAAALTALLFDLAGELVGMQHLRPGLNDLGKWSRGEYVISLDARGARFTGRVIPAFVPLTVEGEGEPIRISLEKAEAVTLRVVDPAGRAVEGARLRVRGASQPPPPASGDQDPLPWGLSSIRTNVDGLATLPFAWRGSYIVEGEKGELKGELRLDLPVAGSHAELILRP